MTDRSADTSSVVDLMARHLDGRSHRWLAGRLGISQSSVSAWFKGTSQPSAERLDDIEQALDIPAGELKRAAGLAVDRPVDIVATGPDRAVWLIQAAGAKEAIDPSEVEERLTAYARERDLLIDHETKPAWRRYTMDQVEDLVADLGGVDEILPGLAAAARRVEGPATFFVLVTRRMEDLVAESKLATLRRWQEDRGLSIEDLDRLIEVLRITGGKRPAE